MRVVLGILLSLFSLVANANVPSAAYSLIPVLRQEIWLNWLDMPLPSALAAQVDKETCITQTHSYCWNPRAELKTKREYGFGLGQFTAAYDESGRERFNVWRDLRNKHPDKLTGWTWENRYDPRYQLRAMVLYNRSLYQSCAGMMRESLACMFAAYNGGLGGVMMDRTLCDAKPDCDPSLWFGHVEKHSVKQKTKVQGYGESFFDINRRYVREVLHDRRTKYVPHMEVRLGSAP